MAPEKEGGRTRRKAGAGRGAGERTGRTAEKAAGQPRDVTMVDVDPWGSFFERFWEQAGGGDAFSLRFAFEGVEPETPAVYDAACVAGPRGFPSPEHGKRGGWRPWSTWNAHY